MGQMRLMIKKKNLVAAGASEVPERRLFAALAASTAAAVHRQLGQHDAALHLNEAALSFSDGAPEATFDATLGLAADAIATDDATTAQHLVLQARGLAEGRNDWWRQRVQLAWVEAEVALVVGDPSRAADGLLLLCGMSRGHLGVRLSLISRGHLGVL